jgi:hypothetical protein
VRPTRGCADLEWRGKREWGGKEGTRRERQGRDSDREGMERVEGNGSRGSREDN